MLLRLGARPALVNAQITIRDGIAWGKGITVVVTTPGHRDKQGYWPDYELIGRVESVSGFHNRSSEAFETEMLRHPDYVIGRPGGCDGPCVEGYVLFTPYAADEDVRRLMHFDLSCLTRWRYPCRTQADIMPFAWAQYEQEQKLPVSAAIPVSNTRLVQILARDASAIAVVRVISIMRQREPDGYVSQRTAARVLQVLKGGLWHDGETTALQAWETELQFQKDESLLVLLDPIWTETTAGIFNVERWQVFPPTAENFARVHAGIAEDFENRTVH
jgi:hypothetical protein